MLQEKFHPVYDRFSLSHDMCNIWSNLCSTYFYIVFFGPFFILKNIPRIFMYSWLRLKHLMSVDDHLISFSVYRTSHDFSLFAKPLSPKLHFLPFSFSYIVSHFHRTGKTTQMYIETQNRGQTTKLPNQMSGIQTSVASYLEVEVFDRPQNRKRPMHLLWLFVRGIFYFQSAPREK